ncbi:MAG: DeoR/GlpR family DNA-binding transcription regulator [Anaerolineae bacterium]|jgi:DeoR/GlpR family transcriptional regulator of sugar metabolism
MDDALYAPERQAKILTLLQAQRRVSVSSLSERFGVSAVTIRNDLSELERRGELVRTHGGAILTDRDDVELAFSLRSQLYSEQKAAIGEAAATLIGDSEAIVIDASTTALQVARHIGSRRELTVVTNSLMVAYELASVDGITVVITGGILRPVSYSLVGEIGTGVLSQFHISKGFFGAKGLTLAEGLTDADSFEVRFKRALVTACKEVIAVVDSSKWGQVATASFAAIGQVSRIFTDPGAPAEMVQALQERGVEVHLAGGEQGS